MIQIYWHSDGNCWVRFVNKENGYEAEISSRNPHYPSLSLPWVTAENQDRVWSVYDEGDLLYFQIYQGQLYSTDGSKNKLTQNLQISLADEEGFTEPANRRSHPLDQLFTGDFSSGHVLKEIDASTLPLTPEEQTTLWAEIQGKAIGENLSQYWTSISTFSEYETESLLEDLRRQMTEFPRSNYSNVHEYLGFLVNAFEPGTPLYEAIERSYSTTDFEHRHNIEDHHRTLVMRKKSVYEGIILHEIETLKHQFRLNEPLPGLEQSEDHQPDITSQDTVSTAQDSAHFSAFDSSEGESFHATSEASILSDSSESQENEGSQLSITPHEVQNSVHIEPSDSEQDEPILKTRVSIDASTVPLRPDPLPVLDQDEDHQPEITSQATVSTDQDSVHVEPYDSERVEPILVPRMSTDSLLTEAAIKAAAEQAQKNYSAWYQGQSSLRGPNGFFTRFRHGSRGQENAKSFIEKLETTDPDELVEKINSFLTADERRYHHHSFASFLLDELRALPDSPWKNLPYDEEKKSYDKKDVEAHFNREPNLKP